MRKWPLNGRLQEMARTLRMVLGGLLDRPTSKPDETGIETGHDYGVGGPSLSVDTRVMRRNSFPKSLTEGFGDAGGK